MSVYKYVDPERIDVIRNKLVRCTPAHEFNDPFELKPHITQMTSDKDAEQYSSEEFDVFFKEAYSKLSPKAKGRISKNDYLLVVEPAKEPEKKRIKQLIKSTAPMLRKKLHDKLSKRFGVMCFTEVSCNLLMWSHYASSHTGLVLEFDEKHPFFHQKQSKQDLIRHIRRVSYSNKRPREVLDNILPVDFLYCKGSDWRYEKEWRMIFPLSEADKVIQDSNGSDIHLLQYDPQCLRSITLGCKVDAVFHDEVIQVVSNDPELSHVNLYQSNISEETYELTYEPVII